MATSEGPKYHKKEWLRKQYWDLEQSQSEIAEKVGVCSDTIGTWMRKHDLETRDMADAVANGDLSLLRDPDWLREKYWEDELSSREIGEVAGFDSSVVVEYMERHDIPRRGMSEALAGGDVGKLQNEEWLQNRYWGDGETIREIAEELGVGQYTVNQWLKRHGIDRRELGSWRKINDERLNSESWLRERYWGDEMNMPEIAQKLGVSEVTVLTHMDKFEVDRRELVGENSPHWRTGERHYGSGWNIPKRRKARIRDQARCQHCGMTEPEHIEKHGTKHHVHHLTPARYFDNPEERNAMSNLITLCAHCHLGVWEPMSPLRPDTRATSN